jgi:hypothetical protein
MKVAFAQMCNDDIGFGLLLLIFSPQRRPFPDQDAPLNVIYFCLLVLF